MRVDTDPLPEMPEHPLVEIARLRLQLEGVEAAARVLMDEAMRVVWAERDERRDLPHLARAVERVQVALTAPAAPKEEE